MESTGIIGTIAAIVGTLGGWEAVKYLIRRKANARIAEAEADNSEFAVLRDTMIFLEQQLKEKEERFAEQTKLVRQLNTEVLELTQKNGQLELDLNQYRCVVKRCGSREPQNGY